jgi:hypothetical protein
VWHNRKSLCRAVRGWWHFAHRYSRRTKDKPCTCAKQYRPRNRVPHCRGLLLRRPHLRRSGGALLLQRRSPWSSLCQDHVRLQGDQLFREMRSLLREGEKAARARRSTLSWKIRWSAITQALCRSLGRAGLSMRPEGADLNRACRSAVDQKRRSSPTRPRHLSGDPSRNCTSAQKPVVIGQFPTAQPSFWLCGSDAPVHFGGPLRRKIALKGVPELFTIVAAGAAPLRPDVVRADPERL